MIAIEVLLILQNEDLFRKAVFAEAIAESGF
jgi:hypothetical protein